jgi:hypothetical protein
MLIIVSEMNDKLGTSLTGVVIHVEDTSSHRLEDRQQVLRGDFHAIEQIRVAYQTQSCVIPHLIDPYRCSYRGVSI